MRKGVKKIETLRKVYKNKKRSKTAKNKNM